jgi:hypothetical protein
MNEIRTPPCVECKHFINSYTSPRFGRCKISILYRRTEQYNRVTGKVDKTNELYNYCCHIRKDECESFEQKPTFMEKVIQWLK